MDNENLSSNLGHSKVNEYYVDIMQQFIIARSRIYIAVVCAIFKNVMYALENNIHRYSNILHITKKYANFA